MMRRFNTNSTHYLRNIFFYGWQKNRKVVPRRSEDIIKREGISYSLFPTNESYKHEFVTL
jgi:hypothetical protein